MDKRIYLLIDFIKSFDKKADKASLSKFVQTEFCLIRDRVIFYNDAFAIRFSSSKSNSFSNTIISLSNLQKYDDLPFIVCLNTPNKNYLYLANTTFIKKISHSSHELREDNIRGSINGCDIEKTFNNTLDNCAENFEELFAIHSEIGFDGNIVRLVEATNNISPNGTKFEVFESNKITILSSVNRAREFVMSDEYNILKNELDKTTKRYENEIILASLIDNVNIRGRVIEYIIAGEDENLRKELIDALRHGIKRIPSFRTNNTLGDFVRIFDKYNTSTDIKTKVMILNSAPKAYNLDKILEFLSKENSVFLFYFVGIMPNEIIGRVLISMFQNDLLKTTHLLYHWAGRNSRGVAQFNGKVLDNLIKNPNNEINIEDSKKFLNHIIEL